MAERFRGTKASNLFKVLFEFTTVTQILPVRITTRRVVFVVFFEGGATTLLSVDQGRLGKEVMPRPRFLFRERGQEMSTGSVSKVGQAGCLRQVLREGLNASILLLPRVAAPSRAAARAAPTED